MPGKGVVEKPASDRAPSNLAMLSTYVLEPEIFDILEHTAPGAGGRFSLRIPCTNCAPPGRSGLFI